ncbi:Gldg family protein [Myxococcota bacterium]|nr:Gldg family protein [Myxococcota bacterium]
MEKRIHPIWPTWAVFAGLVALFFGERVFEGDSGTRTALAVVCGLLVAAAIAVRGAAMASAPAEKAPVAKLLFATTLGVGVALALYALIPLVFTADDAKNARAILWVAFPIVLVCAATPLAAMELATAPAAFIDRYELRRVKRAFERGLALALLVSVLFVGNFVAARHEAKWDLSYGQKTLASEQTKKAVRELTQPVKVRLFFPKANEVAEVLEVYFDSLKAENPNLSVERLDHALASAVAKDVGVTENGFMTVSWEKAHEKVRIGDKLQGARSALRKLDQSFVTALIKVTQQKRTAYFTTGHAERAASTSDKDQRSPTKMLKKLLEDNQYTVRNLGLAEGLADGIPKDASMVFIMGPEKPFSEAELASLNAAADRGARILVALEGERDGDALKAFLEPLGLRFEKTILANERTNVPLTRTEADRTLIWSNRYSSHESVTTMTRSAKLATVFGRTGYLVKADKTPEKLKVDMVLTSVDDTFADLNGNLAFDKDTEKKSPPYGLAAAVTKTSTTGKKNDETRIFVIADTDVFADDLLRFEGNVNLLADIVYWLRASDAPVVPTTSSEDKQIVHKKEEDALWFWMTTVGVPALVLAGGFFGTKRRRR